jgi:tRNA 2-selenouridine synthase
MLGAPRITLSAPPAARADYLLSAYADIIADAGAVASALDRLKPFHAKEILTEWLEMAASKNWRALAIALIDAHYDPLYERSRLRGRCGAPIKAFTIEDFDGATFERVAREIASVLSSAEQRKV